ncbi:lipase family protein [Neisseria subflava]|uniref:lipase family protein n=1 Tax=Neisseria subflava TaxID=28449 RepID=UPI00280B302F|nr:Mbeg1-like protein [Neisseria subflava]
MRALNSQDFALLSDHIYGKKDENGVKRLVFDNEKNKEITLNGIKYAVERISDNPKNGYFGAIYRRLDTNELIVVHRGTEFETRQDREADMRMVKDHTNPQYNDARALTEVANAMAKHNGAKIYQTGHSLGGALAQLCGSRYNQRTETFNAFGAAGLKEALPINPLSDRLIVNHRMGGDYVSSASNHLGRSIFYTTSLEVSNLRKGGFGTHSTEDDKFFANAGFRMPSSWDNLGSASDVYTSHAVSNFTPEHGLSILSPNSPARKLAEDNMAMIERFNNYVKEEVRKSPDKFERSINLADKFIAENQQQYSNPHEQQEHPQYAHLHQQMDSAKSYPNIEDMPQYAQNIYHQGKECFVDFCRHENIHYREEDLDRIGMSMAAAGYAQGLRGVSLIDVDERTREISIAHESPDLNEAVVNMDKAAVTPTAESLNQIQQTAQQFEYETQQRQLAQSQSRGMMIS